MWRALRPGGWIIFGSVNRSDDPLTAALADFRSVYWCGRLIYHSESEALLTQIGFPPVKVILRPGAPAAVVAGRRPL